MQKHQGPPNMGLHELRGAHRVCTGRRGTHGSRHWLRRAGEPLHCQSPFQSLLEGFVVQSSSVLALGTDVLTLHFSVCHVDVTTSVKILTHLNKKGCFELKHLGAGIHEECSFFGLSSRSSGLCGVRTGDSARRGIPPRGTSHGRGSHGRGSRASEFCEPMSDAGTGERSLSWYCIF